MLKVSCSVVQCQKQDENLSYHKIVQEKLNDLQKYRIFAENLNFFENIIRTRTTY